MPSSQLVRSGMRARYRTPARYQAALKIGKFLYSNRNKLKRGASALYSARKKRSKFSKRMEPNKKNLAAAIQQDIANSSNAEFNTQGKLYIKALLMPQHSVGNQIGSRDTNRVYLKGIKLCRQFFRTNNAGRNLPQMKINYALVQLKCPLSNVESSNETAGALAALARIRENFFRANVFDSARAISFFDYTNGTDWSNIYNCQPMNPNGNFNILTRMSKTLTTRFNSDRADSKWYWDINKYQKVGKWISFDSSSHYYAANPIFEVWWINQVNPLDFNNVDIETHSEVETFNNHTVYFANAK